MEFDQYGIEAVRKNANNANTANKILDLLEKLELDANENNSKRWIWELIQNAKDVVNSSGKVKINLDFSEKNKVIKFEHNGRLFSKENLVYLIQQVSTKDRELQGKVKRSTGKFGTGFLTTHLLSKIVNVSGFYEDEEHIRKFSFKLDRSGHTQAEIINSIEESFEQLKKCEEVSKNDINDDNLNTCFTYILDDNGVNVAKSGIENLKVSLPYVFAFISELESVSVSLDNNNWYFKRENIYPTRNERINVHKLSFSMDEKEKSIYICISEKECVEIAIPLMLVDGNNIVVDEYSEGLPKIFCDFPLVGTEIFSFPVVINSHEFNPTEPRDSIYLTDKENEKIIKNKLLLAKGIELYDELLSYISTEKWNGVYNICKLKNQQDENYISTKWVNENIVNECKEIIKNKPIIESQLNEKIKLYDEGCKEQNIWIISDQNKELRLEVWKLANYLFPNKLTKYSEIENWYNSLWSECHNFNLRELILVVEKLKNINILSEKLNDNITCFDWLNNLYYQISTEKEVQKYIRNEKIRIFPNQEGDFCSYDILYKDLGIDNIYKDIVEELGIKCRSKLLRDELTIDWIDFLEYDFDDVFREIEDGIKQVDKKENIYKQIVVLYDESRKNNIKQDKLIRYINLVFPGEVLFKTKVKKVSEKLLETAIKKLCKKVASTISSYKNLNNFSKNVGTIKGQTIEEWLSDFISYLVDYKYENLLNIETTPILPNQNGIFKIKDELSLDSGEIDEILKDILYIAGNDIRNKLLLKDIFLKLPDNRTIYQKDISQNIILFIKNNQGKVKEENQDKFNEFYVWLSENEEKRNKYFQELWKNKHWLLDDNEIASCMKKSELYDSLLEEYHINDLSSLKEILERDKRDFQLQGEEKIEITEEFLIQSGIDSKEKLDKIMSSKLFENNFIHKSEHNTEKFKFANKIQERSKQRVLEYLKTNMDDEYDLDNILELDKTIFLVKKYDKEIYLIIRPSDYGEVLIYYDSEKDILDYTKDWELWVENGKDAPEKITFGKMLKLTGINRIPLKRIK